MDSRFLWMAQLNYLGYQEIMTHSDTVHDAGSHVIPLKPWEKTDLQLCIQVYM